MDSKKEEQKRSTVRMRDRNYRLQLIEEYERKQGNRGKENVKTAYGNGLRNGDVQDSMDFVNGEYSTHMNGHLNGSHQEQHEVVNNLTDDEKLICRSKGPNVASQMKMDADKNKWVRDRKYRQMLIEMDRRKEDEK